MHDQCNVSSSSCLWPVGEWRVGRKIGENVAACVLWKRGFAGGKGWGGLCMCLTLFNLHGFGLDWGKSPLQDCNQGSQREVIMREFLTTIRSFANLSSDVQIKPLNTLPHQNPLIEEAGCLRYHNLGLKNMI